MEYAGENVWHDTYTGGLDSPAPFIYEVLTVSSHMLHLFTFPPPKISS